MTQSKRKRRTKKQIEQDTQFEKDIQELLAWDTRMCAWIKDVEKAEKEVGWKNKKLYNKQGVLVCEISEPNLKTSDVQRQLKKRKDKVKVKIKGKKK